MVRRGCGRRPRAAPPGAVGNVVRLMEAPRPTPWPAPPEAGGWVARLRPVIGAQRRDVVLALTAAVLGQGVAALAPVIEKVIVDDVITTQRRPLAPWLALLLVTGLFGFGAAYVRRYVGGRVALAVQYD